LIRDEDAPVSLQDDLRSVDAIADRFLEGRHIPGIVYGIVADGDLVHVRGIGTLRIGEAAPPNEDSVFRIASMTKSFTAAAVLQLRDEGSLALDDPVARHVPALVELRGPTADSPPITIRHLLTMASGLATDDPWGDRQQGLGLDAFDALLRGPLTFAWAPGTRFEYSNLGYGILGRLITNVAGAEYRDVIAERLLRPLGMGATTYLVEDVRPERRAIGYLWRDDDYLEEPADGYGALASMGGIFTSVRDLARWVAGFLDAFPARDDPDDSHPLSRATRREMQQVHQAFQPILTTPSLDGEPGVTAGGYGMGLFVTEDARIGRVVGHGGGYPGYGTTMRWHPASGLGIVVLANHRYAPSTHLGRELLTELVTAEAVPARRIRPADSTVAARAAVEGLLERWDDDVVRGLAAMNLELDEPLEHRRGAIAALEATHGRLTPDPDSIDGGDSPLHLLWWLNGERGRVKVEVRLSPEHPPRVQTMEVTSVPEPSSELAAAAAAVVGAVNSADPGLLDAAALDPRLDRDVLDRAVRIAAARYAPVTLGRVEAGDGIRTAAWRIDTRAGILDLAIDLERDSGLVSTVRLAPRPPVAPPYAD
jgi:CubicO group peptidase (beta-lactamase class C family)